MKLLVVASLLVASSLALPQGGYLPPPPRAVLPQDCPQGQVPHGDGCAVPEVTRHVLVFTAPALPGAPQGQRAELPPPRVEHNVIFVRVPEAGGAAAAPLVIPPPQQRNVIYVLNRRPQTVNGQEVIQLPDQSTPPEVFFVNYDEGDDTILPGGISLQQALSQAQDAGGRVVEQIPELQNTYGAPALSAAPAAAIPSFNAAQPAAGLGLSPFVSLNAGLPSPGAAAPAAAAAHD